MLKSFWWLVLLVSLLVVSGHAVAQGRTVPTQPPLWSMDVKGFARFMNAEPQLLVAETGSEGQPGRISALDPQTGKRQWKSDRATVNLFAIQDQTIYADDFGGFRQTGNLLTLNVRTGKTQAILPMTDPGFNQVMGVAQNAFIYKSYGSRGSKTSQDKITAQNTSKVLWTYTTPADSQVSDKAGIVLNDMVVLPILVNPSTNQRGYHVTALNSTTGKLLWQWNTQAEIETIVLGDAVYVSIYSASRDGTQPGWVKALDLKTGKERWTHTMLGGLPSMASDREVFVLDRSEKASTTYRVLDALTGSVLRQFVIEESSPYGGNLHLVNNTIYKSVIESTGSWLTVENHSRMQAFDAKTGKLLWQTPARRGHIYDAIVMGDRLITFTSGLGGDKNVVQSFQIPQK